PPSNPKFGQRSSQPPLAPVVRKGEKSDIPPPPPPKSPLEHVQEMAKKDAIFISGGKEISSDKAIEMFKKDKNLNIGIQRSKGKRPIVSIYARPIVIEN
ncbi:MAG: hypothetical protein GY931_09100, partial [Maribacter sp.]|nr:hypothetical protein [Maribacter sp.]